MRTECGVRYRAVGDVCDDSEAGGVRQHAHRLRGQSGRRLRVRGKSAHPANHQSHERAECVPASQRDPVGEGGGSYG